MNPEFFGYLASVLLVVSLSLSNNLRFRWMNTGAAASFVVYGIMINALPITITNGAVLAIDIYYLYKIYNTEEEFDIVPYKQGDKLITKFLSYYHKDINHYFPNYAPNPVADLNFMVLRDMHIANIFSAHVDSEGVAEVQINYTIAKYRDFKVGQYIFHKERSFLIERGVKSIHYSVVPNAGHKNFLEKSGFIRQPDGGYELKLVG